MQRAAPQQKDTTPRARCQPAAGAGAGAGAQAPRLTHAPPTNLHTTPWCPPPPACRRRRSAYVGEKGLLWWLNQSAWYGSGVLAFIWVFVRFVGPALGLWKLAD